MEPMTPALAAPLRRLHYRTCIRRLWAVIKTIPVVNHFPRGVPILVHEDGHIGVEVPLIPLQLAGDDGARRTRDLL